MSDKSAILQVLRTARERLARPGGWIQGDFERNGGFCVAGACGMELRTRSTKATSDAISRLEELIGRDWIDLWNDAPGRTQAEVVALVDRAISEIDK